jgi:hypothetical protein
MRIILSQKTGDVKNKRPACVFEAFLGVFLAVACLIRHKGDVVEYSSAREIPKKRPPCGGLVG